MSVGGDVGGHRGETSGSAGGTGARADALPRLDAAACEPAGTAPVTMEFDTSKPNIARVYDALLGGKDNYAADRELAGRIVALNPGLPGLVRDNRAFIIKPSRGRLPIGVSGSSSTSALACRRTRPSMRQCRGSARTCEWLTWTMTR